MNEKNILVAEKFTSGTDATWKIVVTNTHDHQLQLRSGSPIVIIKETKTATVNVLESEESAGQSVDSTDTVDIPSSANLAKNQQRQVN